MGGGMSIELQSDFSKGKSGNISSDELTDCARREDIQTGTVRGRLSWIDRRYLGGTVRGRPRWYISLLRKVQGTPSWFTSLELEQHEDQAQRMKSRVQTQNVEVQYGSSTDQVQSTSAVFKCRCIDKHSDQVQDQMETDKPADRMISVRSLISQIYQPADWQLAGNGAKLEPRSSSRAGKNRTSSAADKRGAYAEDSLEQD
ncbi:hypothetical protein F511_35867 [Dorcoceras hygrometricum]|uniref:Uncharacterized protein n=1 Tax=Dorcoceras hygrometricum TaxID=472368 RepID=A0A2Z7ALZ2_9LAMI|nr:hypothetical protein F511_35867 [Dorcoceras hygrometricum]